MKETEKVVPMPSRLLRASTRAPRRPPEMVRAIPGHSDDHDLLDQANDDALVATGRAMKSGCPSQEKFSMRRKC
jgi:hypothetical protein